MNCGVHFDGYHEDGAQMVCTLDFDHDPEYEHQDHSHVDTTGEVLCWSTAVYVHGAACDGFCGVPGGCLLNA